MTAEAALAAFCIVLLGSFVVGGLIILYHEAHWAALLVGRIIGPNIVAGPLLDSIRHESHAWRFKPAGLVRDGYPRVTGDRWGDINIEGVPSTMVGPKEKALLWHEKKRSLAIRLACAGLGGENQ